MTIIHLNIEIPFNVVEAKDHEVVVVTIMLRFTTNLVEKDDTLLRIVLNFLRTLMEFLPTTLVIVINIYQ